MTTLNPLDPSDPQQDKAAVERHDRIYGWRKEFPREYTNIARNSEYQPSVPQSWLDECKDAREVHLKLWEWHNRKLENILELFTPKRESSPTLFAEA